VEPEGPVERLIAEVWASLLEVERVGATDNFFELGGHSLLAMQAVRELEAKGGLSIPPRSLFFKTVRQLADSVEATAESSA
jgi:acyl carrier protein